MGTMEVEVDERQRISLGKVIDKSVRRLRVEQLSGGELAVEPDRWRLWLGPISAAVSRHGARRLA